MTHVNRHVLNAWLYDACRRGEVEAAGKMIIERTGAASVMIRRIRKPRSHAPWYAVIGLGLLAYSAALGFFLWTYRVELLTAAGVLLAAWFLISRLNHSGACPGLHCAGCRH